MRAYRHTGRLAGRVCRSSPCRYGLVSWPRVMVSTPPAPPRPASACTVRSLWNAGRLKALPGCLAARTVQVLHSHYLLVAHNSSLLFHSVLLQRVSTGPSPLVYTPSTPRRAALPLAPPSLYFAPASTHNIGSPIKHPSLIIFSYTQLATIRSRRLSPSLNKADRSRRLIYL